MTVQFSRTATNMAFNEELRAFSGTRRTKDDVKFILNFRNRRLKARCIYMCVMLEQETGAEVGGKGLK